MVKSEKDFPKSRDPTQRHESIHVYLGSQVDSATRLESKGVVVLFPFSLILVFFVDPSLQLDAANI